MKKVTLKSTTTHKCYTYKTVKSNSYLTIISTQNDTNSDNFDHSIYELDVPSTYNGWEGYSRQDGE